MKFKLLSVLASVFILTTSGFSQFYDGRITKVYDGKTAVLTLPDGKFANIWLQFIEVPEPEQQLSSVVKEHLEKLVLNKDVRFAFYRNYSQGWIGVLFLGEVEINKQMLRDGAAWFDLPENKYGRKEYVELETLAKNEKRGIWSVQGLKPSWEFRAEKYLTESRNFKENPKKDVPKVKIMLPTINSSIKFIDYEKAIPKDYVVVGVGYLESDPDKMVKAVKKAKIEDLVCAGYEVPAGFKAIQQSYSKYCPANYYMNNAVILVDANSFSADLTKTSFGKAIRAYRLYRVTGNYEEFLDSANDAIKTIRSSSDYFPNGLIRTNLLLAADALSDAILVKSSRDGDLGARLGASALLALNDKYGLNDVGQYSLDREIIDAGIQYLNVAGREASKLGIVQMK